MLEGNGFEVEDVGDGLEALERVSAGSYDLMVLDLNTPCLDGFEVMTQKPEARIRQSLVMTGHFPEEVVEDCLEGLSVLEVLRKPVMITTLLDSVDWAASR